MLSLIWYGLDAAVAVAYAASAAAASRHGLRRASPEMTQSDMLLWTGILHGFALGVSLAGPICALAPVCLAVRVAFFVGAVYCAQFVLGASGGPPSGL